MSDIVVEGLQAAMAELRDVPRRGAAGVARALYRIAHLVKRVASRYAPISPTASMLRAVGQINLVNRGVSLRAAQRITRRRNPRATSRRKPGGLQSSITARSNAVQAEVYVPAGSPAGRYAWKIHEEKGVTWWKRGIGTQAKGSQADHKFITRAYTDQRNNVLAIIKDEYRRAAHVELQS